MHPEQLRVAEAAVEWAAAEGWNPGLDDAERFARADPEAFLATERDGEIIATVSCALYGDRYAFVGFFIVARALRASGVGSALLDRALERAGGRTIGLDGVLEQQRYYERRGFELARRNVRWRTASTGGVPAEGAVALSSVPFDELLAYDASVFGSTRERFLRSWVQRPPGCALACRTRKGLSGYGVLRHCLAGAKVGPLFADDEETAELLLRGLLAAVPAGTDVFIDLPAANPRTERLRASREMEPVFETARMYRGAPPPEVIERVFGVTSFEFG